MGYFWRTRTKVRQSLFPLCAEPRVRGGLGRRPLYTAELAQTDATADLGDPVWRASGLGTTNVDPPGSILTVAEGISDPGVIVGVYLDSAQNEHGLVLKNGTYTQVNVPASNGNGTEINSINRQGEIAGYWATISTVSSGRLGSSYGSSRDAGGGPPLF